jgi:hypothetical protein
VGEGCGPDAMTVEIRRVAAAEVEERWRFVGSKAPQRWVWHAMDHLPGVVLASAVGSRADEVFCELQKLLTPFGLEHLYTEAAGGIPVKVGIFRNFGGFAEIEACKGMYHRRGESQERAR